MTRWSFLKLIGVWLIVILGILIGSVYADDTSRDVPKGSWVYKDMNLLYHEGVINDYPYEWVNSWNELSRFEIAYYLKQFITTQTDTSKYPTGTSPVAEALLKLIAEFRTELGDLGIQIADINKVSPNLVNSTTPTDGYQDVDSILSNGKEPSKLDTYYYYGQYYKEMKLKTFIFIPMNFISPAQDSLLEGDASSINILYQPKLGKNPSFLVVKGNLPVTPKQSIRGLYLFPVENQNYIPLDGKQATPLVVNYSILALLEEVNQIQQIDSLWRINGDLPLDGYVRLENDLLAKQLLGSLNQGMKIGGLLVYSGDISTKSGFDLNKPAAATPNPTQKLFSQTVDLDSINGKYLQSIDLNLKNSLTITQSPTIYNGLESFSWKSSLGQDSFWPNDIKAGTGLQYQINDYWSVLGYQSFVNSQTNLFTTTGVGVQYNDWVTLWLAYRLLNFNDPVVAGTVSFRF